MPTRNITTLHNGIMNGSLSPRVAGGVEPPSSYGHHRGFLPVFVILAFIFSVANLALETWRPQDHRREVVTDTEGHINTDNGFEPPAFGESASASRPRNELILHVGPPKTGSTSIQCGLSRYSAALAKDDNYYYLGKPCPNYPIQNGVTARPFHWLLRQISPTGRFPDYFELMLQEHHLKNHNIIISVESMFHIRDSPKVWNALKHAFQDWNVTIVIAYRRFYEMVPSTYYQQNIVNNKYFPTFREYYSETLFKTNLHPSEHARQLFRQHFENIQVINLHAEGDLVENFICQVLPFAPRTCGTLHVQGRNDTVVERQSRTSKLEVQELWNAATKRGLIRNFSKNEDRSRRKAWGRVEKMYGDRYIDNPHNIPRLCLSHEEQEVLLNTSLSFEENAWDGTVLDFAGHYRGFRSAVQKQRFCSLDLDRVIDDEWIRFFSSL